MSLGVALLADSQDVWGKHRVVTADLTGDAAYPTGGYAVTAAQFGMRQLYGMAPVGGNAAGGGFMVAYLSGTGKLMWFNPTNTVPALGPAVEASANQASVNTAVVRVLVYGE